MKILGPEETAALLPYERLVEGIGDAVRRRAAGEVTVPDRLHIGLGTAGTLLVMPAADDALAITKLVTVHPANSGTDLATIQGEVVALDARTGRRLAVLDGAAVTGRRTAAASALAARILRPGLRGPVLIVGAGAQARAHLEAFHAVFGVDVFFLCSRTPERARELARHARTRGLDVTVVAAVEDVLGETSVVVTATTSREPVIASGVREDALVLAVGAYRHDMAEVDPDVVARCELVVVDDMQGARAEAGDLLRAVARGVWSFASASTLQDIVLSPREAPGLTLYKSVGHALFDLAACRVALGV